MATDGNVYIQFMVDELIVGKKIRFAVFERQI